MSVLNLIRMPDPDEPDGALLFVDGALDSRPYRFLADTGAARSHVLYDDYTASFASADQSSSSGIFERNTDDVISVPALDLDSGAITRQNFALVRFAASSPFPYNLIGMDIFRDFCCHFRFDENRIDLNPPDQDHAFQPLQMDQAYHPYLDVQFGPNIVKAVWDTGASITVVDLAVIDSNRAFFEPVGSATGTDSTGTQMETPMFVMSGARIGGRSFASQRVAGVDLSQVNTGLEIPMALILGYNTLRQTNWLFDFPGKRWAFTASTAQSASTADG